MTSNERVSDKRLTELVSHYENVDKQHNGWWVAVYWCLRELQERRSADETSVCRWLRSDRGDGHLSAFVEANCGVSFRIPTGVERDYKFCPACGKRTAWLGSSPLEPVAPPSGEVVLPGRLGHTAWCQHTLTVELNFKEPSPCNCGAALLAVNGT